VLFAFRDAARAAQVAATAADQIGVRSVAVVGRSADSEIRIISRVGAQVTDARSLASTLAVLDVLSWPLGLLAGSAGRAEAVTLPDSNDGFATFGRLIPRGAVVILVAVCDDSEVAMSSFENPLGAALIRIPAERAIRMSACEPTCEQAGRMTATAVTADLEYWARTASVDGRVGLNDLIRTLDMIRDASAPEVDR
jgi:hypothetical protein